MHMFIITYPSDFSYCSLHPVSIGQKPRQSANTAGRNRLSDGQFR